MDKSKDKYDVRNADLTKPETLKPCFDEFGEKSAIRKLVK